MARVLTFPAGKRAKFVVAIVFFLITAVVGGLFSGKFEDAQENETVSFLPGQAESVKSLEAVKRYPGGELAPAVIVYERNGGLTAADRRRVVEDQRSFAADRPSIALAAAEAGVLGERRRRAVLAADPRDGGLRPLHGRRWTTSATASAARAAG